MLKLEIEKQKLHRSCFTFITAAVNLGFKYIKQIHVSAFNPCNQNDPPIVFLFLLENMITVLHVKTASAVNILTFFFSKILSPFQTFLKNYRIKTNNHIFLKFYKGSKSMHSGAFIH